MCKEGKNKNTSETTKKARTEEYTMRKPENKNARKQVIEGTRRRKKTEDEKACERLAKRVMKQRERRFDD